MPEENAAPDVICPRCDKMTDYPGHVVTAEGVVTKCPFITVDVVIQQPTKRDRIV